jgi:hypothetical protein
MIWEEIRLAWADGNTYEGGWKNDNISPGTKGLVQRYFSCFFMTCHSFDFMSFATATACTYLGFLSDNLTRYSSFIFTHQLPLTWSFHILADFFTPSSCFIFIRWNCFFHSGKSVGPSRQVRKYSASLILL